MGRSDIQRLTCPPVDEAPVGTWSPGLEELGIGPFSGRYQGPACRIVKFQVEVGHSQSPIGIPHASRPNVEQAGSSIGKHLAAIHKTQLQSLAGLQGLGKDHSNQVVALSGQLGSFDCGL